MNIKSENNGGKYEEIFNLEEEHDRELLPLIRALCEKAQALGVPIFVVTNYKTDQDGAWLASSARARGEFVPQEFYIMRSLIEGTAEFINLRMLASKIATKINEVQTD